MKTFLSGGLPLSISLAVYCQDSADLVRTETFLAKLSPYFTHILVVCNMLKSDPSPSLSTLPNISLLNFQSQITQGAALNKLLTHITTAKVLIIDAKAHLDETVLSFIYDLHDTIDIQCPYIIGFQTQINSNIHATILKNEWKHGLSFSQYLPWGGLFFDPAFLLSIGGFQDQLSNKAMMIDLCLRAQNKFAVMLQSQFIVSSCEKESPNINKEEFSYLKIQYPSFYSNRLQRFFSSWRKEQKNQNLLLN